MTEDAFRSGLFLLKDTYFPFDPRLNVRHILEKAGSFLKDHRVGGKYVSRILVDRSSYYGIDARIILCLLQVGSGLLSRAQAPDNRKLIDFCFGLRPGSLPAQKEQPKAWGFIGQVDSALFLLKRFKSEGDINHSIPIMMENREVFPLNAATYAICCTVWTMKLGFRDIMKFRRVYKELFQTKENGRSRPYKKAPRNQELAPHKGRLGSNT